MTNRTTVRDVPTPPSPPPAPFLLCGWLAYVERIIIRLSKPVSMLNTPRNTPAGESESRLSGGKDVGSKVPFGGTIGNESYGPKYDGGGSVEKLGIVQYPRHGKGCLSGLQRYIIRCARDIAKAVNSSRVNSWRWMKVRAANQRESAKHTHDGQRCFRYERHDIFPERPSPRPSCQYISPTSPGSTCPPPGCSIGYRETASMGNRKESRFHLILVVTVRGTSGCSVVLHVKWGRRTRRYRRCGRCGGE